MAHRTRLSGRGCPQPRTPGGAAESGQRLNAHVVPARQQPPTQAAVDHRDEGTDTIRAVMHVKGQVAGAVVPSELERIPTIGLHAIPRPYGHERRGDDIAVRAEAKQLSVQPVAGWGRPRNRHAARHVPACEPFGGRLRGDWQWCRGCGPRRRTRQPRPQWWRRPVPFFTGGRNRLPACPWPREPSSRDNSLHGCRRPQGPPMESDSARRMVRRTRQVVTATPAGSLPGLAPCAEPNESSPTARPAMHPRAAPRPVSGPSPAWGRAPARVPGSPAPRRGGRGSTA